MPIENLKNSMTHNAEKPDLVLTYLPTALSAFVLVKRWRTELFGRNIQT